MSRFFSDKYDQLVPYVPGEQPRERKYLKLNTNESPFPPSEKAVAAAAEAAKNVQLYSDPECTAFRLALAERYGVEKENVIAGNGSDEILNFAFAAFCDKKRKAVFADITYGFYPVFAAQNGVPYEEIPLKENYTMDVEKIVQTEGTVFIANPNAPTGIFLPIEEIEKIVASNTNRVVVVDEAYVDFGGESCVFLTKKYDNLLVVGTFSKSRSMAGARLGFGIGNEKLIADLNTLRYSLNPYNVNSMTLAMGVATLMEEGYTVSNCRSIIDNRTFTTLHLIALGFDVLPSKANFLFAKHEKITGKDLYLKLKERGVLVRYFDKPRLKEYNRITIGSYEQMETFIDIVESILEEV